MSLPIVLGAVSGRGWARYAAPALVIAGAAFLSVFFGLVAVVVPAWIVLPFLAVPIFVILTWLRPEYALATLILIVGGFLPDPFLPSIPFLGGHLRAQDLFLGFIACVCLLKQSGRSFHSWPGLGAMTKPLVVLLLASTINAAYSRVILGTPTEGLIEEFRPFVFWTLPFWVTIAVGSHDTLRRFANALLLAAALLALAQLAQATTGIMLIHGSRLETATVGAREFVEVLRSTVPGIYLVIFALLFVAARYLLRNCSALLASLLSGLFVGALLFTFGRTLWATTIVGLGVIGLTTGIGRAVKLAALAIAFVAMALLVIAFFKPETATVMVDRALSVSEEGGDRTSLGWRLEENRLAWVKIRQSPLIGIGIGAQYKPIAYERGWEGEQRTTHNGHVYLLLKLGIIGYAIMVWLWVTYWRESTTILRATDDPNQRALLISLRTLLPMILITSITRPEWLETGSVAVIGLAMGIFAAIGNLRQSIPLVSATPTVR